jgi:hypothetical protein
LSQRQEKKNETEKEKEKLGKEDRERAEKPCREQIHR